MSLILDMVPSSGFSSPVPQFLLYKAGVQHVNHTQAARMNNISVLCNLLMRNNFLSVTVWLLALFRTVVDEQDQLLPWNSNSHLAASSLTPVGL